MNDICNLADVCFLAILCTYHIVISELKRLAKFYTVIIIITHSERALFNLNARVEARGTIVPKAVGRGYYGPERRHKGI